MFTRCASGSIGGCPVYASIQHTDSTFMWGLRQHPAPAAIFSAVHSAQSSNALSSMRGNTAAEPWQQSLPLLIKAYSALGSSKAGAFSLDKVLEACFLPEANLMCSDSSA